MGLCRMGSEGGLGLVASGGGSGLEWMRVGWVRAGWVRVGWVRAG